MSLFRGSVVSRRQMKTPLPGVGADSSTPMRGGLHNQDAKCILCCLYGLWRIFLSYYPMKIFKKLFGIPSWKSLDFRHFGRLFCTKCTGVTRYFIYIDSVYLHLYLPATGRSSDLDQLVYLFKRGRFVRSSRDRAAYFAVPT